MRLGVLGLGKVGLPLALVLRHYGGHSVVGFDIDPEAVARAQGSTNHPERLVNDLIQDGPIPLAPTMDRFIQDCDTVLIMVPTPHAPEYDGTTPMPPGARDFNYAPLQTALRSVYTAARSHGRAPPIIICSTTSPGTIGALQLHAPPGFRLTYNPVFISLGRVAADLLSPSFILSGGPEDTKQLVSAIWTPIVNTVPHLHLPLVDAELAKMALNVHLSSQIAFINTMASVAATAGADVDNVTRLIDLYRSGRGFPRAGLGDGGACRPRDLVVLNLFALAGDIHWFTELIAERERHSEWLADQIAVLAADHDLQVHLLGTVYKPGVPYQDGSPALLLQHHLAEMGVLALTWDPYLGGSDEWLQPNPPVGLYVIGTPHEQIRRMVFTPGSIVFDPWGCLSAPQPDGVRVVTPGRQ